MSNEVNDRIYEASFEDFYELYFHSDSFQSLVDELISHLCDEYTKGDTALKVCFYQLWKNDSELLFHDKRTAVEAMLMFRESMKVFK